MQIRLVIAVVSLLFCASAHADLLDLQFRLSPADYYAQDVRKTAKQGGIHPAPKAAEIDGKLNDDIWSKSTLVGRALPRNPATFIHAAYDDYALYLAFVCVKDSGTDVQAVAYDMHDRAVWRDDCIELWIHPEGAAAHHFIVNAAGAKFDAVDKEKKANPSWSSAVVVTDTQWVVEIAIPMESLGMARWHHRLPFNFGRNGPSTGMHSWASWGSAEQGALVFSDVDFQPTPQDASPEALVPMSPSSSVGDGLTMSIDKPNIDAGERWMEVILSLNPQEELAHCLVRATLTNLAGDQRLARVQAVPTQDYALLFADLRTPAVQKMVLTVELLENGKTTAVATQFVGASPVAQVSSDRKIAIQLDVPGSKVGPYPVTFGIPMPAGGLWDVKRLGLVDTHGNAIAHQTEVTGLWGREGSIRWVRFDALVDPNAGCFVTFDSKQRGAALKVSRDKDHVTIDTGIASYVLGKGHSPVREVLLGAKQIATAANTRGLYVIDQNGRVGTANDQDMTIEIESAGPVAACVRMEGYYRDSEGNPIARHITRVEAFAGKPFANITHTLVLTQNTNEVWFKEVGWELATASNTSGAEAIFGASRDSDEYQAIKLTPGGASVFQDSHYRYGAGENHFAIFAGNNTVREGEEMGDWAALRGSDGGLLISCREAARQHPKEFTVKPDRLTLKLFSNRGGEELDFRSATLAKKWNVLNWNTRGEPDKADAGDKAFVAAIDEITSNAIGWAKTHELMFEPLAGDASLQVAARDAALHSRRVFAHVDPQWIYQTAAMERIYPKAPQRFERAEQYVQALFDWWNTRVGAWGDYGFTGYFAGPHFRYQNDYPVHKRYKATYTLRTSIWSAYARSGQRDLRDFAQQTNITHLDNMLTHWDGPNKTRGLYTADSTSDMFNKPSHGTMPYYWEAYSYPHISTATNLRQWYYLYQLTGYRRAKDALLQYGEGLKRFWTPTFAYRDARVFKTMSSAGMVYNLTWDQQLKDMSRLMAQRIWDPTNELWMTRKGRPYSASTYKFQPDSQALLDGWRLMNLGLCRRMFQRAAPYLLGRYAYGHWPVVYSNHTPMTASWLFDQGIDQARIAESMWYAVASAASGYQSDSGKVVHTSTGGFGHGAQETTFPFEGIAKAMDLAVRGGADQRAAVSWVAYSDMGNDTEVIVQKKDYENADILFNSPGGDCDYGVYNNTNYHGAALNRYQHWSGVSNKHVRIANEDAAGAYWIKSKGHGEITAFAQKRMPMVLHADGYWQPADFGLPVPIFFSVARDDDHAQIFFEGSAVLTDPSGQLFNNGEPQSGWVDLPHAGIWSFLPIENRMVKVRNLPPFFAFRDKSFYFVPEIQWRREPFEPFAIPSSSDVFVDGVSSLKGDQSLHLTRRRDFTFANREDAQFIPQAQGTIEFYFRPNWSSVALPDDQHMWLSLRGEDGTLNFFYGMDRSEKAYLFAGSTAELSQYVLRGSTLSDGSDGAKTLQFWRTQTFFEAGKWYHIAFTWGQTNDIKRVRAGKPMLVIVPYVNGVRGQGVFYSWPGNHVSVTPNQFRLRDSINGSIDELRISDVMRYKADFTPPSRNNRFEVDENTLALFPFNGDLHGESASGVPLEGMLK